MNFRKKFKKGGTIFHQGTPSDCAFIIDSGVVEIIEDTLEGQKVIGCLTENEIFGEMGLIDALPRSANVIALEDCVVTVMTQDIFNSLSKHNPTALIPVLKVLAKRLRKALEIIEGFENGKSSPA